MSRIISFFLFPKNIIIFVKKDNPKTDTILDLGTGTGFLIEKICELYPKSKIYGLDISSGMVEIAKNKFKNKKNISIIQGDIEALPFSQKYFDLIISSASLQWVKNLENVFKEINNLLTPDGGFYANLFGAKTFQELKSSLENIGLNYQYNFADKNTLQNFLDKAGFISDIESKIFYKYYPDVMTFLKKVKGIGAGNITPLKNNLGQRQLLSNLDKEYTKNFQDKNGLRVTYELISFKAVKKSF